MSKILIADDIEENRYFLEALLRGHGHRVLTARNGAEALESARKETPDLIVTDILMPVMDGFTLCRECKSDLELKAVPFVFYTATYTDRKDRDFGLSLGAQRYLVKPVEPDVLVQILREVLEEASGGGATGAAWQADETTGSGCDEAGYLREHNEALTRKLESKMAQLEEANLSLMRELSERKQAEIQLRRLYTAIENTAECIVIVDARGAVEYANPASEKIVGLARGDTLDIGPGAAPAGFHDDSFYRALRQAASLNKPWTGHMGKKSESGETIELDVTVSPIPGSIGDIDGSVLVMRDVTMQKRLEDQLFQSQKLEALGTLAGGIAHDFNNILSAVMGYTDLTLLNAPEEGSIRENLTAVLGACDRARSLVRQILTFSRKAEHDITFVDLCPLVKETMNFLGATLPVNIEIHTRFETVCVVVSADPAQIHQVLLNLSTNAVHAMREAGGVLEVVLRKIDLDEDAARQHPGLAPGEYALISVSDTGCGMSRGTLSRIFEPFFTTKREGEGTGLGLALAHGIVKSHGGAATVYSEEGRGSTFNIYLPAAKDLSENQEAADTRPLPPGTESVLFVDDEEVLVDIGRRTLERLGYRVTTSTSSVEALRLFRENPDAFDLIIADQAMPRLTGRELAAEVRRIRPDLPVIICTGFCVGVSDREVLKEGTEQGIASPEVRRVIMKPLNIREMAWTVRSVLDGVLPRPAGAGEPQGEYSR